MTDTPPLPRPDTQPRNRIILLPLLIAFVAAGGVTAYTYWPQLSDKIQQSQDNGRRLDMLDTKVAELEKRVSELSGAAYRAQQTSDETRGILNDSQLHATATFNRDVVDRLHALEEKNTKAGGALAGADLDALKTRIAQLEQSSSPAALGQDVRRLMDENRTLQRQLQAIMGLTQLEHDMQSGRPYATSLHRLSPLLAEAKYQAPLSELDAYKNNVIPPLGTLQTAFDHAVQHWLSARQKAPATASQWQKIKGNLGQIITIRRVGGDGKNMDHDERAIAAAETALKNGDLETALNALDGVSTTAAPYFAEWEKLAAPRHQTLQAVNALYRLVWEQNDAKPTPTAP